MKPSPQAHITFGIRGDDLDPAQMSDLLGLQPSHAFSRGEQYESSAGTRHRPFGVWQLRSDSAITSVELEDHAAFILHHLESRRDLIESFLTQPIYYIEIRIWWEKKKGVGSRFQLTSKRLPTPFLFPKRLP